MNVNCQHVRMEMKIPSGAGTTLYLIWGPVSFLLKNSFRLTCYIITTPSWKQLQSVCISISFLKNCQDNKVLQYTLSITSFNNLCLMYLHFNITLVNAYLVKGLNVYENFTRLSQNQFTSPTTLCNTFIVVGDIIFLCALIFPVV